MEGLESSGFPERKAAQLTAKTTSNGPNTVRVLLHYPGLKSDKNLNL